MEEAALTIATGNNNNVDESKLSKNNNNNKSPVSDVQDGGKLGVLNNLPANWFLNLNNKLVEAGNLGLIAGNLRNYHHLAGKLSELTGKLPDRIIPEYDQSRLSPFPKNASPGSGGSAVEGKSSPSSGRESPPPGRSPRSSPNEATPNEDKSDKSSSPIWPAWWSTRNPSPSGKASGDSPTAAAGSKTPMPMLVHPPQRSQDEQPLDFSVSTKNLAKFKPKMTISQTKTLINNLQNGHLNLKKNHSHSVNNRHRHSYKSSSSSSAGSEDEGAGPPSSTVESPGPLRGESGEYTHTQAYVHAVTTVDFTVLQVVLPGGGIHYYNNHDRNDDGHRFEYTFLTLSCLLYLAPGIYLVALSTCYSRF